MSDFVIDHEFGTVNYVVLSLYLLAMLTVGLWAGRRTKGAAGYFVGEGKVNHILVGLSLLGTYLSSLTMMALPATAFKEGIDWEFTVQLPFLLLTAVVITGFVLPRFREAGCISVYGFLEQQIHVSARLLASVGFVLLSIGRMGLVLYLPALAFHTVTGANLVSTIIAMGLIVTLFTVIGGIRGVIWTDAIQVVIFVIGAVITLGYVLAPGAEFFRLAAEHGKFRVLDMSTNLTEIVTLWLILETIFQTIRIYATQQDMTQRYMSAESTQKANQSVWMSILGYIPLGYLFYFIGVGLFVHYLLHPDPQIGRLIDAGRQDAIYAYFVVTRMPAGIAGLVIAAMCAASLSTISSSMNSASAVCVEDFYRRFWARDKTDEHFLWVGRGISLVWGVLAIGMAFFLMEGPNIAQIVWGKIMAVSTCGTLALMALAFLPRRINAAAAVIGVVASWVTLFVLMFSLQLTPEPMFVAGFAEGAKGVNYLLWPVITNVVAFAVALIVDALLGGPRQADS